MSRRLMGIDCTRKFNPLRKPRREAGQEGRYSKAPESLFSPLEKDVSDQRRPLAKIETIQNVFKGKFPDKLYHVVRGRILPKESRAIPPIDSTFIEGAPKALLSDAHIYEFERPSVERFYDKVYSSGAYSNFQDKIPLLTQARIEKTVNHIVENRGHTTDALVIMDYGCGDGRYFPVAVDLATRLAEKGVDVHYVGYDPSAEGLQMLQKKATRLGLQREAGTDLHAHPNHAVPPVETTDGYVGPILRAGNLKLSLVHGQITDSPEHIKSLLPNADLSLCMTNVLGLIPTKQERQATLKLLGEKTKGHILLTVAGVHCQPELLTQFTERRQKIAAEIASGKQPSDTVGAATGDNDILFVREVDGKEILCYSHLYPAEELRDDCRTAGLNAEIGAAHTQSESHVIAETDPQKIREEFRRARDMPPENLDREANYLFVSAANRPDQVISLEPDLNPEEM